MSKLSRAFWKGSLYHRKESNDWRQAHTGKIVNAPKSASIQILKNLAKRSGNYETTDTHSYGRYPLHRRLTKRIS